MSILIIEDDAGVRNSLSEFLVEEGYTVVQAPSGPVALRLLKEQPPPELILLDLMMPEMDGAEFRARQIEDDRIAGIPVVVISARPDGQQQAQVLGACDFLSKPMSIDELLMVVQNRALTIAKGAHEPLPHEGVTLREACEALRRS